MRAKTLREFDSADKARELLATIDAEYERSLRDDASNIAAFPTVPSEDRVRASLHAFRQLVSEPNVTLRVCAVCAERRFLDRFRIFRIGANHDSASTSNTPSALPESLLLAMKSKLVHDPAMPSHLPPLTGGT
jgi:sulfur relay (sulfurtransferase) complex TusBCD TusD component (DsrE family)